jgi:hypothetical protein
LARPSTFEPAVDATSSAALSAVDATPSAAVPPVDVASFTAAAKLFAVVPALVGIEMSVPIVPTLGRSDVVGNGTSPAGAEAVAGLGSVVPLPFVELPEVGFNGAEPGGPSLVGPDVTVWIGASGETVGIPLPCWGVALM